MMHAETRACQFSQAGLISIAISIAFDAEERKNIYSHNSEDNKQEQ